MLVHTTALDIMNDYILGLPLPTSRMREQRFKATSDKLWASKKLRDYIARNPSKNPMLLIEMFRDKMKEFSKYDWEDTQFLIAYHVACDILEICYAAT